jgi:hypothetical protein
MKDRIKSMMSHGITGKERVKYPTTLYVPQLLATRKVSSSSIPTVFSLTGYERMGKSGGNREREVRT